MAKKEQNKPISKKDRMDFTKKFLFRKLINYHNALTPKIFNDKI